jgi:hypothetical protein
MNEDRIKDTAAHFYRHIAEGGRIELNETSCLHYAGVACFMCHKKPNHSYAFEQRKPITFIGSPRYIWYVHENCADKFMEAHDEVGLVLACEIEQKVWLMGGLLGDARWVVGAYLDEFARVPGAVFSRMCTR